MFGVIFDNEFGKSLRGYHLLKTEKDATSDQQTPKLKRLRRLLFASIISICLVIILIIVFLTERPMGPEQMLVSALLSRLNIPQTTEVFRLEHKYTLEEDDEKREAAWAALYPPAGGFITGFDPARTELDKYQDLAMIPDQYCLSVFHQLHCLESLSKAAFMKHNKPNSTLEKHGPAHLAHCVSYLMQAITCAGDKSLEKSINRKTPEGETTSEVTGWFTEHKCHSHKTLFDFAARYTVALDERDYEVKF